MPIAKTIPVEIPVWQFNGHDNNLRPDYINFKEWFEWKGVGDGDGEPVLNIINKCSEPLEATVGCYISIDANGKVYPIDPVFFNRSYDILGADETGQLWAAKKPGIREFWDFHGRPNFLMPKWVNYHEWKGNDRTLVVPTNEGPQRAEPDKHVLILGVGGEVYPITVNMFDERYEVLYLQSAWACIRQHIESVWAFGYGYWKPIMEWVSDNFFFHF